MKEQKQQTRKASRRIRQERLDWKIQFAPQPLEGQPKLIFDDEPAEKGNKDE